MVEEQVIKWISRSQLLLDIEKLIPLIPPNISHVAGIPRSGMVVASDVSTRLSLPLYSFNKESKLIELGNGNRLKYVNLKKKIKILIIDDAINTGNSFLKIINNIKEKIEIVTATIYLDPDSKFKPDIYLHKLKKPQLFEWQFFGGIGYIKKTGFDVDGVLFSEIKPHYPLYLPRGIKIPLIATGRHVSMKKDLLILLKKWDVSFNELVMWKGNVKDNKRFTGIHNADAFKRRNLTYFIAGKCI